MNEIERLKVLAYDKMKALELLRSQIAEKQNEIIEIHNHIHTLENGDSDNITKQQSLSKQVRDKPEDSI